MRPVYRTSGAIARSTAGFTDRETFWEPPAVRTRSVAAAPYDRGGPPPPSGPCRSPHPPHVTDAGYALVRTGGIDLLEGVPEHMSLPGGPARTVHQLYGSRPAAGPGDQQFAPTARGRPGAAGDGAARHAEPHDAGLAGHERDADEDSRIVRPYDIRAMNVPTNGAHDSHHAPWKTVRSPGHDASGALSSGGPGDPSERNDRSCSSLLRRTMSRNRGTFRSVAPPRRTGRHGQGAPPGVRVAAA